MLIRGETVQAVSDRSHGKSRGFDYLRLGLATAVITWHAFQINYGDLPVGVWRFPIAMILPMFFSLSGYLVSGSLLRVKNIHEFVALRAMRIIPALAVETTISVILIGAMYTTLPPRAYWLNTETLAYLMNVVGYIHRSLPGVFQDHHVPLVNAPLWTIPFELECYLAIILLWVIGAVRRPKILLASLPLLQAAILLVDLFRWGIIDTPYTVRGRVLLLAFLCGVVIYLYRQTIRIHWSYFVIAVALCAALLTNTITSYFVAVPAAYATVYLGLKNPRLVPILFAGDFSYGIYLYGYPIQQAIYASFPSYRVWWFNLPVALMLAGSFAAFSWFAIEKPVLARRKKIVGKLDQIVEAITGKPGPARPLPDSPIQAKLDAD